MLPKKGCSHLHPPTKAWGSPAPPQGSRMMAPLPIFMGQTGNLGAHMQEKEHIDSVNAQLNCLRSWETGV